MKSSSSNTMQGAGPTDRALAPALQQLDQWALAEGDGGLAYWQAVLGWFGSVAAVEAWINELAAELRASAGSFEETTGRRRVFGLPAGALAGTATTDQPPHAAEAREALLFLDFDGTTHPDGCGVDQLFSRMSALEPWLRQHVEVGVVISSSWREAHPLDELRSFFSDDLQERILGATPIAAQCDWANLDGELLPIRFEREAEVLAWLRTHGAAARPWVALDDQAWRFRPFCKQLVVCDPKIGLTERELRLAAQVLGLDPGRNGSTE